MRNEAHQALLTDAFAFIKDTGHRPATGLSCRNGKRPDIASFSTSDELWIWELKTRFEKHEIMEAWQKYHTSCHRLTFVFPAAVEVPEWRLSQTLSKEPSFRHAGALLLNGSRWLLRFTPHLLTPTPADLAHLTLGLRRQLGLQRQPTNAAASSSRTTATAESGAGRSPVAPGAAPSAAADFVQASCDWPPLANQTSYLL